MHELILGPTKCGKTVYAMEEAKAYLAAGFHVLVCDPFWDNWPCTWQTDNRADFLRVCKQARRCALFIDEAGQMLKRDTDGEWFFTVARHWGHKTHVMAQGYTQLLPIQRNQCSTLVLFADSDPYEAADMARKFNEPLLATAPTLPKHHFFLKERGEPLRGPMKLTLAR